MSCQYKPNWHKVANRAMLPPHGGLAQTDLESRHRALPITRCAHMGTWMRRYRGLFTPLRRIAPPLYSDLIYDRDRGSVPCQRNSSSFATALGTSLPSIAPMS